MKLIEGDIFHDSRGELRFVNGFDMQPVRRIYCIRPAQGIVRAWQGHRVETKWFHVVQGSFLIKWVSMDDTKLVKCQVLNTDRMQVLEIPPGYYNGLEALKPDSLLMVFSDSLLEDSKADDFRLDTAALPWK
jgi:dTDP-4-dehydrorhamnose 3,5-epimerase-like enzyme